jgi:hypothetical protein
VSADHDIDLARREPLEHLALLFGSAEA